MPIHYSIYPLSESAITLSYGSEISVEKHYALVALMNEILRDPFTGFKDISIAYSSISIFFDPMLVHQYHKHGSPLVYVESFLLEKADQVFASAEVGQLKLNGRLHQIPVCYDFPFSPDLQKLAATCGTDIETVISLHTAAPFYVFMIGFTPGFPYMGVLPQQIEAPRKDTPSLHIKAGSVGIAGKQTGIYPVNSPGGWNIIGRTPIRLFDPSGNNACLLEAGDKVQFSKIDITTFYYLNQYEDS